MTQFNHAQDVCDAGIAAISNSLKQVKTTLRSDLDRALEVLYSPARKKYALRIDLESEDQFRQALLEHFGSDNPIKIVGEETLRENDDFSEHPGTVCIVDPIDGTDLLERNLSNWCIAAIFIRPRNPEGQRIIATCVGLPSGRIYYSRAGMGHVEYKFPNRSDGSMLLSTDSAKGPSGIQKLKNASICFYGQKAKNLKAITELPLFDYLANQPQAAGGAKNLRIYNLGGIPMMVKMIDREVKFASNIDVVFDALGQRPYDAVPGIYLALKGGAKAISLENSKPITEKDLEREILKPAAKKMRYVVAATQSLCTEIAPYLQIKKSK